MLPFGGALMRIGERCFLPAVVSACLMTAGTFGAGYCMAQEPPRDTAQPSNPASSSDNNRRAKKKLRAELSGIDRTWLMEEVPYIISDDERRAFLGLGTAEEREQFIEMFCGTAIPTRNHR